MTITERSIELLEKEYPNKVAYIKKFGKKNTTGNIELDHDLMYIFSLGDNFKTFEEAYKYCVDNNIRWIDSDKFYHWDGKSLVR